MLEIPGYQILRELGRGGMATVYLAVQQSLGREVAIKILSNDLARDPAQVERFLREAGIVAKLEHHNIIAVHDVGMVEGRPYLAMECLPAGHLPLAPGVGLPPSQALAIARDIALALDHAHAYGVIHRDVKPENIMRRRNGTYALSDFGIARCLDGAAAITQEGVTVGTPQYMSPEQLQGGNFDGRSDLYSLGVVLHQLLTGRPPYQGTDGWAIGMQHINAPLPTLPEHLHRYQPLIDALMAKQPDQRPATGAVAAELLAHAIGEVTPVPTPTAVMPPITSRPRKPWLAAASALAAIALGVALWSAREPSPTPAVEAAPPALAGAAKPTADARSIAVLSLLNIGGQADNEYFSDGLAKTLLDMLARVPDLKVIARTSSFAFKGQNKGVREIGQALDVAHLLEGSVQQAGGKVRITVQLVRTDTGAHVWSQRYDRDLSDVFAIQDEIATAVVTAIQGKLSDDGQQRLLGHRTGNLAAYQEYLKGNALLRNRNVSEMEHSLQHFERAIELDPGYAGAYAAAATALALLDTYSTLSEAQQALPLRYCARALELDPMLGEAHFTRGALFETAGDYAAADRDFRRGVELAPGYATGFQWYAEFLFHSLRQPSRALTMSERALALDPLTPTVRTVHALTLLALHRDDEATLRAERLNSDHPSYANGHWLSAEIRSKHGDLVGALLIRPSEV